MMIKEYVRNEKKRVRGSKFLWVKTLAISYFVVEDL